MDQPPPKGTIVFTPIGVSTYGFDVFSVLLPPADRRLDSAAAAEELAERRHTDGVSINFNGQFLGCDDGDTVAFASERDGSTRLYLARNGFSGPPEPLPHLPGGPFHDRPTVRNGVLYFAATHEPPPPGGLFRCWSAVYSARLGKGQAPSRLTPPDSADFSPAVSPSGELVAVASYGSRPWKGDFHELETEIVVFRASDPDRRVVVAGRGGWPAWSGESTLFFHRVADDRWWSVFRVDLTVDLEAVSAAEPRRVTPPGLHAFTPAAANDEKRIAVATRRRERKYRHVELFDLETEEFHSVTELINPEIHHYNPFFSVGSRHRLGYHRFRGESAPGDSFIPCLQQVTSPVSGLRMLRVHGSFPSFSPNRDFIAVNGDFTVYPGLTIIRSDGSKRWILLRDPVAFYTSWSPTERGVVFTTVGPIFQSARTTVQVARVTFDTDDLNDGEDEIPVEVKILTREDTGNNAFPSCSPDGNHVVFRSGRSGQKNLYIVDAVKGEHDGGEIRQLTDGDWVDTMPCWSPDGELIAFSSNRHDPTNPEVFGIYLVRPDGTGLRRVHVAGLDDAGRARERFNHVCFSPDSSWLLFGANLGGVSAESVAVPNQFQPYGDLFVCRLDGSGLRRLTCDCYENGTPTWVDLEDEDDGAVGIGRSSADGVGDKLTGQFDEPLWLTCDM